MAAPAFKPLTLTTVSFSLTEGTNIPEPLDSPPHTPTSEAGPLTSHLTTPNGSSKMVCAFPPSPASDPVSDTNSKPPTSPRNGHFLPPTTSRSIEKKRPSSVRRLLSLRSIRSEKDKHQQFGTLNGNGSSNSDTSSRPGSPYTVTSNVSNFSGGSLSKKRNSAWFGTARRKSGFFLGKMDQDSVIHEGGAVQPVESKGPPPPTLPEFHQFGSLDGALGSDMGAEDMFKDIN